MFFNKHILTLRNSEKLFIRHLFYFLCILGLAVEFSIKHFHKVNIFCFSSLPICNYFAKWGVEMPSSEERLGFKSIWKEIALTENQ